MHQKLCIPASGNAKWMLHLRFAEVQADVCSTACGTAHKTVEKNQVLKLTEFLAAPLAALHTSACISAKRICAVRFVFPLARIHNLLCISSSGNGNQNNYKISARGDAIFWLYFRKRNCRPWIVFPRGEL